MTSKVMQEMAADIQVDLDDTLLSDDLGNRQPFESTSGIATTMRRMHDCWTRRFELAEDRPSCISYAAHAFSKD